MDLWTLFVSLVFIVILSLYTHIEAYEYFNNCQTSADCASGLKCSSNKCIV